MDQLASLRCTAGHALFLDNRTLDAEQVPLDPAPPACGCSCWTPGVHHGTPTASTATAAPRASRPPTLLGVAALRDIDVAGLDDALDRLRDDELRRRVRHVVHRERPGASTRSRAAGRRLAARRAR